MNRLPFMDRLVVPAIAAPMLRVSGIELVSAACAAGVIGAFPTANCSGCSERPKNNRAGRPIAPTSSCGATPHASRPKWT